VNFTPANIEIDMVERVHAGKGLIDAFHRQNNFVQTYPSFMAQPNLFERTTM
jgi:hypothetical protein